MPGNNSARLLAFGWPRRLIAGAGRLSRSGRIRISAQQNLISHVTGEDTEAIPYRFREAVYFQLISMRRDA